MDIFDSSPEDLSTNIPHPLGYWVARVVVEGVLMFGIFAIAMIVFFALNFDSWPGLLSDKENGWSYCRSLALCEIMAIVLPWLILGYHQGDTKIRSLFLLRRGLPMSIVIAIANIIGGNALWPV